MVHKVSVRQMKLRCISISPPETVVVTKASTRDAKFKRMITSSKKAALAE